MISTMTWGEFKEAVEILGVRDGDVVRAIHLPFGKRRLSVDRDQVWPDGIRVAGGPEQVPYEVTIREA
jgi:hypothetical protein